MPEGTQASSFQLDESRYNNYKFKSLKFQIEKTSKLKSKKVTGKVDLPNDNSDKFLSFSYENGKLTIPNSKENQEDHQKNIAEHLESFFTVFGEDTQIDKASTKSSTIQLSKKQKQKLQQLKIIRQELIDSKDFCKTNLKGQALSSFAREITYHIKQIQKKPQHKVPEELFEEISETLNQLRQEGIKSMQVDPQIQRKLPIIDKAFDPKTQIIQMVKEKGVKFVLAGERHYQKNNYNELRDTLFLKEAGFKAIAIETDPDDKFLDKNMQEIFDNWHKEKKLSKMHEAAIKSIFGVDNFLLYKTAVESVGIPIYCIDEKSRVTNPDNLILEPSPELKETRDQLMHDNLIDIYKHNGGPVLALVGAMHAQQSPHKKEMTQSSPIGTVMDRLLALRLGQTLGSKDKVLSIKYTSDASDFHFYLDSYNQKITELGSWLSLSERQESIGFDLDDPEVKEFILKKHVLYDVPYYYQDGAEKEYDLVIVPKSQLSEAERKAYDIATYPDINVDKSSLKAYDYGYQGELIYLYQEKVPFTLDYDPKNRQYKLEINVNGENFIFNNHNFSSYINSFVRRIDHKLGNDKKMPNFYPLLRQPHIHIQPEFDMEKLLKESKE